MVHIEPRNVKRIKLHLHGDEIFAVYESYIYGRKILMNTVHAVPDFSPSPEKRTPKEWAAIEAWNPGGGGDSTDEHASGKKARIRGTSAAKMTAEGLGITDLALLALMEEINHFDSSSDCPETHLCSLLKMLKVLRPGTELTEFDNALRIMNAVHSMVASDMKQSPDEVPFDVFIAQFLRSGGNFTDEDALGSMRMFVDEEIKAKKPLFFSLRTMYHALWRTHGGSFAQKDAEVKRILGSFMGVLYSDQCEFHSFLRGAKMREFKGFFDIPVQKEDRSIIPVRAALIISDNSRAHAALRYLGSYVTVVKNTRGNTVIQGDKKKATERRILSSLDRGLTSLIGMCRYLELPPEAKAIANWSILTYRGDCPVDDHWHLAEENWLAAYNGTHNHAVRPTQIDLPDFRSLLEHAYVPRKVENWRRENGVPENRFFRPSHSIRTLARALDRSENKK